VDYNGTVYQCVRERDVAWQGGHWPYNQRSIGIEHAGYDEKNDVTDSEYHASARLAAHICQRFNIPIDRKHIIAHNEVPGCPNSGGGGFNCHTCPGDHWDWRRYMRLIREYASSREAKT
jgi:N-acetyl-anhydromuramyl-L-alanine amidase AmpD